MGVATGGAKGAMLSPPPTSISEPNKVQKFQFQMSGILLFTGGYYTAQKFHDFTVSATIFGQFTAAFHFI